MKIDNLDLNNSLQAARIYMASKIPLCYSLVQNCQVVFTDSRSCKTACVTPNDVIYINPDFWGKLSLIKRVFLLSHEVFHPAFDYFLRSIGLNSDKANRAHDYVINLMLDELIPGGFIDGGLLEKDYEGMSFEEVYSALKKQQPDEGEGEGEGAGEGEGEGGQVYGKSGLIGDAMLKDIIGDATEDNSEGRASEALSSENMRANSIKWKQRLHRAFEFHALQQGVLPGRIRDQINNRLNPKVSWETQLHATMGEMLGKVRPNYNRMNRRSASCFGNLAYPAEQYSQIDVAVYIDTSGSITRNQLERAFAEIDEVVRLSGGRIRFLEGDAVINTDEYISCLPDNVHGGGGTSFVPLFEHLDENPENTKAIVVFTDSWGSMPDFEPTQRVVWAVYSECMKTGGVNVPFGEIIEIPPDLT